MPEITRRRFIRDASLGAAAVGTVAAAGPALLGSVGNATEAVTASEAATAATASVGADTAAATSGGTILAHLLDAESGTFAVYFGTQEVTIQSPELAQKLASATR